MYTQFTVPKKHAKVQLFCHLTKRIDVKKCNFGNLNRILSSFMTEMLYICIVICKFSTYENI
jgi:hypothetical protein